MLQTGSAFTPYESGLLKSPGIEKDKPFAPDRRMKRLLTKGVQISVRSSNPYQVFLRWLVLSSPGSTASLSTERSATSPEAVSFT